MKFSILSKISLIEKNIPFLRFLKKKCRILAKWGAKKPGFCDGFQIARSRSSEGVTSTDLGCEQVLIEIFENLTWISENLMWIFRFLTLIFKSIVLEG